MTNKLTILFLLVVLNLTACASHPSVSSANKTPEVKSYSVIYLGKASATNGVDEFLGIPFAQAPVGALRWAAPSALVTQASQVQAQQFKPACMQGPHIANWYKGVIESFGGDAALFPTPEVSEDCLYLNIWRPSNSKIKDLPVFVFIHGGSNRGGWAYEPNYLGSRLSAKGAVVITIAYRLGVFGFFSHPELSKANFGLLDQIAALNWVKQNAQAFGGDSNNITVAGESSGASNIAYLLAAPAAKGLFQRATHQSAGWAVRDTQTKQRIEPLGLRFAKAASGQPQASMANLRELSSEQVLTASEQAYANHFFDPVIDQDTVTKALAQTADLGELAKVDLLIGTNANESLMYLAKEATVDSWLNDKSDEFSAVTRVNIKRALSNKKSDREKLDFLATSYDYTCPSLKLAQQSAKTGGRTWFYHFAKVRDGELASKMGAYHGAELPYIFNTHDNWLPTSKDDRKLSEVMMAYWLSFARSGDPNSNKLPAWALYRQNGDSVQTLGVNVLSRPHPSNELCQLMEN